MKPPIDPAQNPKRKKESWEKYITIIEWGTLAFCLISIVFFAWGRPFFKFSWFADTEVLGHYGDFVGGLVACVIAYINVRLLVKTLKNQIEANAEIQKTNRQNIEIYTLQQFHDTFTTLMGMYHDTLKDLKDDKVFGKVYLHGVITELYNKLVSSGDFDDMSESALKEFRTFYAKNVQYASVYFRILYRLFQHIDDTDIDEKRKASYAKIIRSQLSEDELLLLRYNAKTHYGKKMQKYINSYNLLKHLPVMNLLEMKPWKERFSQEENNYLNILFSSIQRSCVDSLVIDGSEEEKVLDWTGEKYQISVIVSSDKKSATLKIRNSNSTDKGANNITSALNKLKDKELLDLMKIFLKEMFVCRSFGAYMDEADFSLETHNDSVSMSSKSGKSERVIAATVTNKNGYELVLSNRQLRRLPK